MTDEELDKARAEEAWRIFNKPTQKHGGLAMIAARLAREGWVPVDPDLLAVRVVLGDLSDQPTVQDNYLSGRYDTHAYFRAALAAYKAGKEAKQ